MHTTYQPGCRAFPGDLGFRWAISGCSDRVHPAWLRQPESCYRAQIRLVASRAFMEDRGAQGYSQPYAYRFYRAVRNRPISTVQPCRDCRDCVCNQPRILQDQEPARERPSFFAGRINRRKNVAAAIRAVRELVAQALDVSLHAAGALSDEQYLAEVHQLIQDAGLESRVKLLGRVGQDVLTKEHEEANVFLLPSLQENALMAIAEAMAAGVAVVSSRVCGMPTMVEEGKAGYLVEPNDIPDITGKNSDYIAG